jgi:hypothetical protein
MRHTVDEWRIGPVIDRITLGLFYHHFGERLPDDYKVVGVPEWYMDLPLADEIIATVRREPLHDIGQGVFQYHFLRPNEQADRWGSTWVMRFFEDVPFMSMTVPITPGARTFHGCTMRVTRPRASTTRNGILSTSSPRGTCRCRPSRSAGVSRADTRMCTLTA